MKKNQTKHIELEFQNRSIELEFSSRFGTRTGWEISKTLKETYERVDKGFKLFVFPALEKGWRFKIESPDGVVTKSRNKPFQSSNEAFVEAECAVWKLQHKVRAKCPNQPSKSNPQK